MNIAELAGININYKIHGNSNNKAIVLISGFSSDHKIWSFVIPPLLTNNYKVLVFDNRGIGLTSDDGVEFDVETMADDTAKLLNFLNINKAHIIGHSMGGLIAQQFTIKYPQIADRLIVVNSSSYTPKTLEYALGNQNQIWGKNFLPAPDLVKLILPWLFSNQFLEKEEYVNLFINSILYQTNTQSIFDHTRQLNALIKADLRNQLHQIEHDTLIISSAHDLLVPPFINNETTKFIKNSKLISIPGGHISPVEQPELLAQTILDFLN